MDEGFQDQQNHEYFKNHSQVLRLECDMPYIKVNLNGRKYVISGLTERTSSKHILCSLARVDSNFHLDTTELSDSSVEAAERNKGVRGSRSKTRHTRVRHSSKSSLEITEWKNCLRGSFSEKRSLKHVCVVDNTKSEEWTVEKSRANGEKCSRKLLFKDSSVGKGKWSLESKNESALGILEMSSEDQVIKRDDRGKVEKRQVKRRKRKDVTSWKDKQNERNERGEKIEIGEKGWKSADDVRGKKSSHCSLSENNSEKRRKNGKTKSRNSHESDTKLDSTDRYIVVDAIDKPSEYRRVQRHVREELNKLKIQKFVSRAVDQRLVDFQVACLQSQRCNPEIHLQNEQETKIKLIQLVNSQKKCLSALDKAQKRNNQALKRYKRYLNLDKQQIQFYNASVDREKLIKQARDQQTNDTDHDTGISEQHSDSSNENKHTTMYDMYNYDVSSENVIGDDVIKSDNKREIRESKTRDAVVDYAIDEVTNSDVTSVDNTVKIKEPNFDDSKTNETHVENSVVQDCITSDDVNENEIASDENKSNFVLNYDVINNDITTCDNPSENVTEDFEAKTDDDDVINNVKDGNEESDQDVIVAKQTDIVPFDQSKASSIADLSWSAASVTASTLSEMPDCCFHRNSTDSQPRDIERLEKVLMTEKERQRQLKQKIDRLCGEMRLTELRTKEQIKIADVLTSLKNLNDDLVKNDIQGELEGKNIKKERKSLEKSIKLSINLYEYQKGEMNDNALSLQIIESQIKRKRWHVESAVRNLGHFITSSLRIQLEKLHSLEEVAGIKTNVVFKSQLDGTFV